MGQSAADDSLQHSWEAPSINTTDFIEADMAAGFQFDALFHIGTYRARLQQQHTCANSNDTVDSSGDISYARGYEAEVSVQLVYRLAAVHSHTFVAISGTNSSTKSRPLRLTCPTWCV